MYDIKVINDSTVKILNKKKVVLKFSDIYTQIQKLDLFEDKRATPEFIKSCIEINKDIRPTEEGFGLMEWRTINPRSIKDKAIIALKNNKKPMHFSELTEAIADIGLRKKEVTVQAVHNELIRYTEFIPACLASIYANVNSEYSPKTLATCSSLSASIGIKLGPYSDLPINIVGFEVLMF